MRFSTVVSFLLAVILAGFAVYGAQNWLDLERRQISAAAQRPLPNEPIPTNTIVVASKTINFGERLDNTKVREIEWASEILPAGSFATSEDLIVGNDDDSARYALTSIELGEPILTSKITDPGQRAKLSTALTPGMKAISIRVNDVLGVAGFVLPGDRVDVLLTRKADGSSFVDVLLQGLKVLAIDQIADDRKDKPSVVRTVTFEVNTIEAQKLVLGANVGTLSLALRNIASNELESSERVTLSDLNEIDAAEDLVAAAIEAQVEEVEPEPDPSLERIENLEELLKSLSEGVTEQIQDVEAKIISQKPVTVIPTPVLIERSTVSVIRDGHRNEYKVDHLVAEEVSEIDVQEAPNGS